MYETETEPEQEDKQPEKNIRLNIRRNHKGEKTYEYTVRANTIDELASLNKSVKQLAEEEIK